MCSNLTPEFLHRGTKTGTRQKYLSLSPCYICQLGFPRLYFRNTQMADVSMYPRDNRSFLQSGSKDCAKIASGGPQQGFTTRAEPTRNVIRRAQQGDPEAFALLFHAYQGRIYSICMRMTNSAAVAEELTQDAFLQMFRKLSTFRENSALSTWLYRLAVNTVLMHFRKQRPKVLSYEQCYLDTLPRTSGGYCSHDMDFVDHLALMQAIRELPVKYRTILLLHEVAGYGHEEIATLLGCSVASSKARLHKAKRKIRRFFTQPEHESEPISLLVHLPDTERAGRESSPTL